MEVLSLNLRGGDETMLSSKSKPVALTNIGVVSGRPVRDEVIGNDDVLNVMIMLGLSKTADEFIDILNGRPMNVYGY
jgi:hypothetical protein